MQSDRAAELGLPAEQDVRPPSVRQDVLGMLLLAVITGGALLLLFAVIVGLIMLVFYFGVPHEPIPPSLAGYVPVIQLWYRA
jgi:hypothetical protein